MRSSLLGRLRSQAEEPLIRLVDRVLKHYNTTASSECDQPGAKSKVLIQAPVDRVHMG
jgi:hypothetical protein